MGFKSETSNQAGLNVVTLKNTDNNTQIQILPDYGALWHGWVVKKNEDEINLIDHYEDIDDIKKNLKGPHKSANLSPFPCRLLDGKYTFKGKEYEFLKKDADGNAIHGLLVDKPFQKVDTKEGDDGISASFIYEYRHEDSGYPFDYNCEVTYTLHEDNSMTLATRVKNMGDEELPIVDGWHPYFKTGSKVNNCKLQFHAHQMLEFDDKLIPTGKYLPYTKFLKARELGREEIDNSFILDENAAQPVCTLQDVENNISIYICPTENYPILQIYTPPHRESIAIETLSGAPDAFNNELGLTLLGAGEEKEFSVTYSVDF